MLAADSRGTKDFHECSMRTNIASDRGSEASGATSAFLGSAVQRGCRPVLHVIAIVAARATCRLLEVRACFLVAPKFVSIVYPCALHGGDVDHQFHSNVRVKHGLRTPPLFFFLLQVSVGLGSDATPRPSPEFTWGHGRKMLIFCIFHAC